MFNYGVFCVWNSLLLDWQVWTLFIFCVCASMWIKMAFLDTVLISLLAISSHLSKSYSCLLMCQKFVWYMPLCIYLSLSVCIFICVLSRGLSLCHPMDGVPPGSSVHGFSRQEYWSGLPFPTPGVLPNPGIRPVSLVSPALAGRFL